MQYLNPLGSISGEIVETPLVSLMCLFEGFPKQTDAHHTVPVRELIDYGQAWPPGPVSELSPQTGNNQTSFGTTEAGFGAHRQTFATPTAHSLASGNATNDVAA